ncbi:MAG: hypothetical protein ACI9E1_001199 [Cryomorphaceae bacterium]|jgi:hypothetical protein
MRYHRPNFLQLLCSLAMCLGAHAQESMVNLHFISFPKEVNLEPLELLIGEGKVIKIETSSNSVSKSYQVPALSSWVLGRSLIEKGKFKFETSGQVKSIAAKTQLILIIRKDKDGDGGLELIPVEFSSAGFGGGKYFVLNITDTEISGTIGTGEFSLKPQEHILLAPEPSKIKDNRKYCFTKFSYNKDKTPRPFFNSTWRFNTAARSILIFHRDPKTEHLKFHTIRSYIK